VLTRASDSVILDVNREWQKLTGFEAEAVIGRTAMDIGHWQDQAARQAVLEPLMEFGRVIDMDVTLIMSDGYPRLVCLNANKVQTARGDVLVWYFRDVTADRLAQEGLMAGERVLAETNEKLNRQVKLYELTESVGRVGHWVAYPGDPILHFSSGYAHIARLGMQSQAPLGEHFSWLHPQDAPKVEAALAAMDGSEVEYRWCLPQGETIWVRSRMHRQMEGTQVKADFGVVQEITAEKEALAHLQASEERFRSMSALSSDWYWEQDADLRFVRVDRNESIAMTLPTQSFIGKCRWETGASGITEAQWQAHKAVLMARETFHDFEFQRMSVDGSVMWASVSGAPLFDAMGNFTGYRGTGRDITARKKAEAEIERLAFFDSLTSLPNRRLLLDRLKQAMEASARHTTHGALLFIDLDNFKALNDTLGHAKGDALLVQVAARLVKCVRTLDTVARLGGDEFVVMLEDLGVEPAEAATQAELVGRKVLQALNQEYDLDGVRHHSSPSIGVTLFFQHQQSLDELLKRADLAMYQAKGAGRNTLRFFDPAMQAAATARAALEGSLRDAMERKEFLLFYQPVVDENSRTTGVEALIRWKHPERGMVSPAEFIPVAEQSGLIVALGQWVLEAACAQLVLWSHNPATQRLSMSVNVSARQFRHPQFSDMILTVLRSTGANPYRLKLELTESLLVSDINDAIEKMTELRSIGVSFALDDFGTGYSSLSYLKSLPLDLLKIDQSFVRDVLSDANDAAIARTILNLAKSLDLGVVAEGVETAGQREFLLHAGCTAFQGYFFGRPVPATVANLLCLPKIFTSCPYTLGLAAMHSYCSR